MYSYNVTKALSVCDNHFSLIFITCPEKNLQTNKQLINLLYNDVKNLTSILNCYMHSPLQDIENCRRIGPKRVSSNNALSQCHNHFWQNCFDNFSL